MLRNTPSNLEKLHGLELDGGVCVEEAQRDPLEQQVQAGHTLVRVGRFTVVHAHGLCGVEEFERDSCTERRRGTSRTHIAENVEGLEVLLKVRGEEHGVQRAAG